MCFWGKYEIRDEDNNKKVITMRKVVRTKFVTLITQIQGMPMPQWVCVSCSVKIQRHFWQIHFVMFNTWMWCVWENGTHTHTHNHPLEKLRILESQLSFFIGILKKDGRQQIHGLYSYFFLVEQWRHLSLFESVRFYGQRIISLTQWVALFTSGRKYGNCCSYNTSSDML